MGQTDRCYWKRTHTCSLPYVMDEKEKAICLLSENPVICFTGAEDVDR